MAEKNMQSRIMQKHDTEANWKKATNFIPKAGEIIIYDADSAHDTARIKIGNNSTKINDLPFINSKANWEQNDETALDYIQNKPTNLAYINSDNNIINDVTVNGGSDINVTAKIGQTVIIKEVDAEGIPTKWESVDYQPRTHYIETVLSETTSEVDPAESVAMLPSFELVANEIYIIKYNGVEYTCKCFGADGTFVLGNLEEAGLVGGNGEPFVVGIEGGGAFALDLTGATSATISIKRCVPIPRGYVANALPYYIPMMGDISSLFCLDSAARVAEAYRSGRALYLNYVVSEAGQVQQLIFTFSGKLINSQGQDMYTFFGMMGTPIFLALVAQEDGTLQVETDI